MTESQKENTCTVHFLPDDLRISVERGASILSAAIAAGIHISASCGGKGVCGTCKVKVESGQVKSTRNEKISSEEFTKGIRLACQSFVLGDLEVSILPESKLDKAIQVGERKQLKGVAAAGWKYNPPLKKYYLELPAATAKDNANDLFRLMWGLKQSYDLVDLPLNFDVVKKLPGTMREKDWKITVTTSVVSSRPREPRNTTPKIINVEPGDTRDRLYSLAIDVGTTTVCCQLLDLNRGKILAETIVFNQQTSYGADIITRIAFSQKPGGREKLQEAVVASINESIDMLLEATGVKREDICQITAAGNTTMEHLLLGLDPRYIRLAPYTPNANFVPSVKASSLGINMAEHVYIYNFPSISSYVGGDIVAGVIASGMHQRKKLTLYIDIGTNGEIVLGNSDWMVTASCSAGPAFEGCGIKNGMVAMQGAIQEFSIDKESLEPNFKTIGNVKPCGICGSGLINILAGLLETGIIDQNGKFKNINTHRLRRGEDGYEYVIAWAAEARGDRDIVITEVDIDNLMRAKAAMFAGYHTLSRSVDVDTHDLQQVILAGNFGNSLDIEKAITIGLLPDIPVERFTFIGNGSLSGARLVNYSEGMMNAARKVAQMMTNVELSDNADFHNNYMAALFLPHTELKYFPSVAKSLATNTDNNRVD